MKTSIVSSFHRFIIPKRGFSLLELLIVIMIVGVLFVAFRSAFEIKDKDTLYAEACIENIYGQVNNFIYAGLSSKSLFNGTTGVFPDQYLINFASSSGAITLEYEKEGSGHIYSSIELIQNTNISYCSSNSYTILLTGEDYQLIINKGLAENTALQSFYLSGASSISTGGNIFVKCTPEGLGCKTIARFQSDTRTLSLQKQICLHVNTEGECEERDN